MAVVADAHMHVGMLLNGRIHGVGMQWVDGIAGGVAEGRPLWWPHWPSPILPCAAYGVTGIRGQWWRCWMGGWGAVGGGSETGSSTMMPRAAQGRGSRKTTVTCVYAQEGQ